MPKAGPNQFDLVITDMTMPKMTGDLLAQEILKIRPGIPIILSTGFNEKIDEEKAKSIGVHQYIEKPLNKRILANGVREALDEIRDMV
jgi:two-component system cell cycle sensor histidine kinase/response regulator CckA